MWLKTGSHVSCWCAGLQWVPVGSSGQHVSLGRVSVSLARHFTLIAALHPVEDYYHYSNVGG